MMTERKANPRQPTVVPLVRCLTILDAFSPQQSWLGSKEIVSETGIPAPTVSRMLRSLVALNYLKYSPELRKYRLAASVLTLGYAASAHSRIQRVARRTIQEFADSSGCYVVLATRDRLNLIVLEAFASARQALDLKVGTGTRIRIASSPMGWALLAALPESERFYLLDNVERRNVHDWMAVRRRIGEGISQVHNVGYCLSLGESELDVTCIATPLTGPDQLPLVLGCIGAGIHLGRARIERELGPLLVGAAYDLQAILHQGDGDV